MSVRKSAFANVVSKVEQAAERPPLETPKSYPPHRIGKKAIISYHLPEMSDELKRLAIDQRKTLQDLTNEAFNDLLRKYGRHPV